MARPYANDLRRKFLHLKLFRQLPQGPFALLLGNRKLFGARSLVLGSLPPTIAGIPPERRAIHQQSAQEVGIWAGRDWRALRPVRQSVVLRKVTVESSACVARSLSGIGKHKRGLAVGGRLSSAKIGSGKLGLPRLVACVRPQVPFSQPRHGFSRLVA